jgi:hypothetical protein
MTDTLQEASLSRVWQHSQDPGTEFAILTAFRGEYPYEENTQRNRSLAADLRDQGYGFFYLDGYWVENEGTDQERRVKEDSIFTINRRAKDFAATIHRLGNRYDQEAVVVKDSRGTRLIFKDGTEQSLGQLRPGAMGTIYSQLRHRRGATFVFESERDDLGWISRLAGLGRG